MTISLDGVTYTVQSGPGSRSGTTVTVAQPATAASVRPVLAVYGDSFSVDAEVPWAHREEAWPTLVGERTGATVVNRAIGGTGYVNDPSDYGTFAESVVRRPPVGADLVVLFGSVNDARAGHSADAVATGARLAMDAVRAIAPAAALLVIGPQWPTVPAIPALAIAHRDAVRAAAAARGVPFLDSLHWFQGRPDLIWADDIHANADGLAFIAETVTPWVRALLPDPTD